MKTFVTGFLLGAVLATAVPVSGQWAYVTAYRSKDLLTAASAYSGVYGTGVYDMLVAQQYHVQGGGGGQPLLDRAVRCLRQRVYAPDFVKWVRGVLTSDPNRYAVFLLVDRACTGMSP